MLSIHNKREEKKMNIVASVRGNGKQRNRQTWAVKEQKGVKKGEKTIENDVMCKGMHRFEGSKKLGIRYLLVEGGP